MSDKPISLLQERDTPIAQEQRLKPTAYKPTKDERKAIRYLHREADYWTIRGQRDRAHALRYAADGIKHGLHRPSSERTAGQR